MYKSHQNEKRREAILSTSGGVRKECDTLIRRIADRIALKRKEKYSDVVAFIRRRVRFDLISFDLI